MNRLLKTFLLIISISSNMVLSGCVDDMFDRSFDDNYPQGTTEVSFRLDFEPFSGNEVSTRGLAGNSMDNIDDLCLIAYDDDGKLMPGFPFEITRSEHNLKVDSMQRKPSDAANGFLAESHTAHAEFRAKVPYGKYYLYAVANLGKRSDTGAVEQSTLQFLSQPSMMEVIADKDKFLNFKTSWDSANPLNNFEMLGYCTELSPEENSTPTTGDNTNNRKVTIDTPGKNVYCWLRRCATKVTIDFDGSQLMDNIHIYIKRATIHDIPRWCAIGMPNKPSNRSTDILSYKNNGSYSPEGNGDNYRPSGGDEIVFSEGDQYEHWNYISKGKPNLDGDFHSQYAEALFMYENMQGDSPDSNTKQQHVDVDNAVVMDQEHEKDLMPCGSYIEVEAYYVINSSQEVSQGKIWYRFMLGKDALSNFDVERNQHLKITMSPRGKGNDVDWHIEYVRESGWEWKDPYYVSYLYGQSSTVHFRYTAPVGRTAVKMTAKIVANNWWADEYDAAGTLNDARLEQLPWGKDNDGKVDPYTYDYLNDSPNKFNYTYNGEQRTGIRFLGNGWLSLWKDDAVNINYSQTSTHGKYDDNWANHADNKYMNDNYFYGIAKGSPHDFSFREYDFTEVNTDDDEERYYVDIEQNSYRFNIPVFTRPKNLVKQTAYSGNNSYEGSTRTAFIKIEVTLDDGSTSSQVMRIVQVPRVTNPTGIYRESGNNQNFHVVLMERKKPLVNFTPITSDGPWIAEIIGDNNFITLNGRSAITGSTGSPIDFKVMFNKMNTDHKARNACIRVRYNNFSCVHLIFVRQGYSAQQIMPGGKYWHTNNFISEGNEGWDPRDEGSMFKYGAPDKPIDSSCNYYPDWDYHKLPGTGDFGPASKYGNLNIIDTNGNITQGVSWSSFDGDHTAKDKMASFGLPTMDDITELFPTGNIYHGFGVLYADGATEVQTNPADAYGYWRGDQSLNAAEKGMRGVFVYHWNGGYGDNPKDDAFNAKNIFFPIGRAGFGHRRSNDAGNGVANSKDGTIRYSAGRNGEMPLSAALFQPQFFDLYRREGGVYWASTYKDINDVTGSSITEAMALDINYYTFDLNILPRGNLQKHSQWTSCNDKQCIDACFLRGIGQQTRGKARNKYRRKY